MKNQDITQTDRKKGKIFEDGLLNAILAAREWLDILYKIDLIDENDKLVDNHIRAAKAIEVACKLSNQICILGLDRLGKSHVAVSRRLKTVSLDTKCIVGPRQIDRYALAENLPDEI
jgi:hypothetical protein